MDSLKLVDYTSPKEFTIDTVIITGVHYLDKNVLANMSGFEKGAKISIPGDDISKIVKKFWDHGLFEDVKVYATILNQNKIAINIYLKERPRLAKLTIEGVSKSDKDDLKEKIDMHVGNQVTENLLNNAVNNIRKFYIEKGFFNIKVDIQQKLDTGQMNRISLTFHITKNNRVKIKDIFFTGNNSFASSKLMRAMKKTKKRDWKFWNSSKYIEAKYKEDKENVVEFYNDHGYRDAKIVSDSIKILNYKRIAIYINVYEGEKYYFRKTSWVGNTKYPSDYLTNVLNIKKGEVFNQKKLDKRLQNDDDAVSSLYLDNGYLFFSITPTEVAIDHDSIDFEMRIYEGHQATINNVIVTGNTKTNEHVVRRELRTLPGELFSKSDIIRTVRELATLGHFEPEKIEPVPLPNPANSTVDIEYKLVERANDQLEVSGGWGGYTGFIGTVGIKFSNFSYKNFFKLKEWRPVPSGDGQTLSLRLQSNGSYYRSYNATFADPWFGGKKPNSLSFSVYYTHYSPSNYSLTQSITSNNNYMKIIGGGLNLGRRLHWPDDWFTLQNGIDYEHYILKNYGQIAGITNGTMNNFNFISNFGRNSLDQFIFPRQGSSFSLSLQFTPPYSLFNPGAYDKKNSSDVKFNWIEYHKWIFKSEEYLNIVGNLVLMTRANFGIIGRYRNNEDYSPVGKFLMGGSGLTTYTITSIDIVSMRGYEEGSLTPVVNSKNEVLHYSSTNANGGNLYDKFTAELRYPLTLKESATIFGLAFFEAGNCWNSISIFNPFDVKRAAGIGIRVFLPMFGLLGFDLGYGFDPVYNSSGVYTRSGWQPQFTMGQQF